MTPISRAPGGSARCGTRWGAKSCRPQQPGPAFGITPTGITGDRRWNLFSSLLKCERSASSWLPVSGFGSTTSSKKPSDKMLPAIKKFVAFRRDVRSREALSRMSQKQAIQRTRDSVLGYGEPVGRELLNFVVRCCRMLSWISSTSKHQ